MIRSLSFGFALLGAVATAVAAPADPKTLDAVAEAASEAQTRCYRLIHHDTFAFESCLQGLLDEVQKPGPRRLGIEYFGFVGAMNSSRLGMRGADNTAWNMLQRFRKTQKKLRLDDAALCATIPGDCEVRIARMKLIEKSPPPPAVDVRDEEEGHRHAH